MVGIRSDYNDYNIYFDITEMFLLFFGANGNQLNDSCLEIFPRENF